MIDVQSFEGGLITCYRCQALSKRTKLQCGRPAIRGKRVCDFHGGKSTGPKTSEGRLKCATMKTVSGHETRRMREARTTKLAELAMLEQILHLSGVTKAPYATGPKPAGYRKLHNLNEAGEWLKTL